MDKNLRFKKKPVSFKELLSFSLKMLASLKITSELIVYDSTLKINLVCIVYFCIKSVRVEYN